MAIKSPCNTCKCVDKKTKYCLAPAPCDDWYKYIKKSRIERKANERIIELKMKWKREKEERRI